MDIEQLILNNKGLSISIAKSLYKNEYGNYPHKEDEVYKDMLQIADIAIFKAFNNFELYKKIKFGTYAHKIIKNDILAFLKRERLQNTDLRSVYYDITNNNQDNDFENIDSLQKMVAELDVDDIIAQSLGVFGLKQQSLESIGQRLGVSGECVRMRKLKLLKRLSKMANKMKILDEL